MRKLVLIIILSMQLASSLFALDADVIIGRYHLPNNLDIEIFKSENKYYGRIIGLEGFNDGQQFDINNPEEALTGQPLLGRIIINNLEYDPAENRWVGGSMYGPEKGLIFNLKISEVREDEIVVVGSKYLFWKNMTWKKL